jgi:hypothetical protein
MKIGYCAKCERETGFQRKFGFGTFFAVICTIGWWLLALPFYPKRCNICGSDSMLAESPAPLPLTSPQPRFDSEKKCPVCAEIINLDATKCRFCGEQFDPLDVICQVGAVKEKIVAMAAAGHRRCPYCGAWDVVTAVQPKGGLGPWCPHCQRPAKLP